MKLRKGQHEHVLYFAQGIIKIIFIIPVYLVDFLLNLGSGDSRYYHLFRDFLDLDISKKK